MIYVLKAPAKQISVKVFESFNRYKVCVQHPTLQTWKWFESEEKAIWYADEQYGKLRETV